MNLYYPKPRFANVHRRSFLTGTAALCAASLLPASAHTAGRRQKVSDGIDGFVEEGWGPVADTLRASFKAGKELGAACAVYHEGRPVVDLWGGLADSEKKLPWKEDTIVTVASTTKGATAICAHLLVQRGQLDLDAPVTRYWPEFGQAGKEDMPVRYLLSHQAGLPVLEKPLKFEQMIAWDPVIRALEAQRPLWTPGTEHHYHAMTYGFLVGEVVRRVSGKTLGTFFHDEIARPLRLSAWIGLPLEMEPRVARMEAAAPSSDPADQPVPGFAKVMGLSPEMAAVVVNKMWGADSVQGKRQVIATPEQSRSRAARAAENPSGNMCTDARSVARMYAATVSEVDGFRLLRPDTVAAMTQSQMGRSRLHGIPPELMSDTSNLFNMALGFQRPLPGNPLLGRASFGHAGSGGSIGVGDPESRVGFSYVTNYARSAFFDPRAMALMTAVRKCLGKA